MTYFRKSRKNRKGSRKNRKGSRKANCKTRRNLNGGGGMGLMGSCPFGYRYCAGKGCVAKGTPC